MYIYKSAVVSWQEMNGYIFILNEDTNELHRLDFVAKDIWLEIDGSKSNEMIAEIIAGRYDQPYYEVLTDINEFVNNLVKRSLVSASNRVSEVTSC